MTTPRIYCFKANAISGSAPSMVGICLLDKISVKDQNLFVPNTYCLTKLSMLMAFVGSEMTGTEDRFIDALDTY